MCLFRLNGYVIVVFGSTAKGIAKELNVRLPMGSLLAICFVIIDCTPAGIRGDSVFGEVRALSCEVFVISGLKISILILEDGKN